MPPAQTVLKNVRELEAEIAEIKAKNQIKTDIEIVAVTKYSDIDTAQALLDAGLKHFGENRLQVAIPKIEALPKTIHWSMIGHLQSNKVAEAVRYFDRIQSVDSIRLLDKIQLAAEKINKTIDVFLQINMEAEVQKFGFHSESIFSEIPDIARYPNTRIMGIMAFGPHTENHAEIRRSFEATQKLFGRLKNEIPSLEILSMGMSHDFAIAIECGANQIRIGTRLITE